MIVCTCGCKVEDFDDTVHLAIKDFDREDNPAVSYVVYCQKCASKLAPDLILTSNEEEIDWMHNGSRPEIDIERLLDIERKWNWLCENVKEVPVNLKSFSSSICPDIRLKWELPVLVSYTCIGSSISFEKSVEIAMGEYDED